MSARVSSLRELSSVVVGASYRHLWAAYGLDRHHRVRPIAVSWAAKLGREQRPVGKFGMPYVLAQISDIHVGGPNIGSGERFSSALSVINDMAQQPDLVVLTGDNTHNNTEAEWQEVKERLKVLRAP